MCLARNTGQKKSAQTKRGISRGRGRIILCSASTPQPNDRRTCLRIILAFFEFILIYFTIINNNVLGVSFANQIKIFNLTLGPGRDHDARNNLISDRVSYPNAKTGR